MTGYFEIISTSTPHIYHSALVFTPKTSIVRKLYETHARPFVRAVHGVQLSWDQSTTTKTCSYAIELAVWSQCGRFIAITPRDTVLVDILDSATLQRLQTLESPEDIPTIYRGLAFSPGSHVSTSCSAGSKGGNASENWELSVVSWDLQTGGIIGTVKRQGPDAHITRTPHIAHSMNGKTVGVFHWRYCGRPTISIFDIVSGVHTHSHSFPCPFSDMPWSWYSPLLGDIWTHGESLRFPILKGSTVTIWEVGFASGAMPTEVETLSLPLAESPDVEQVLLLPTSCRLAGTISHKLWVWDVRNPKSLLSHLGVKSNPRMSFSSDGRFFACSATGSDIYLWKESPTGYILLETLASSAKYPELLLSPNGELIVAFGDRTIQLWRTKGFTTPFGVLARSIANFVLDFSPDETLAVVARKKDKVVKIIDLKSGAQPLIIDASMEVYGLRVTKNIIVVIGGSKVIAWKLPSGDRVPNASMNVGDSARTINFHGRQKDHIPVTASISPDLSHAALTTKDVLHQRLHIYSVSTGECRWSEVISGDTPWFTPDGRGIWCALDSGEALEWRITDYGYGDTSFTRSSEVVDVKHPPEGYPWGSSRGYQTTDDGWVLGPDGKRLLMLPPPWQSYPVRRVWNGRFLALLHGALSEPVILKLDS